MSNLSIHSFLTKAKTYLIASRPDNIPDWSWDQSFSIQPLAQGEYNMNFLVHQGGRAWVLRLNTGSQFGLTKPEQIAYEYKTLSLLKPAGIAPEPFFLDQSLRLLPFGILGMSYLSGEKLQYQHDCQAAARLMAKCHQLKVPKRKNHLIHEERPLSLTFERCQRMMQVYLDSDLGKPEVKAYLREIRAWADQARHKETYYQQDPWKSIINTEVNNTNWIINRQMGTIHLVDWEKPLWGDPSQDLSHFRVPTTTLWKTNYRMSEADRAAMMQAYQAALEDAHLQDTIEERTRLRDPFNCLRGVSWCAMAWVQYRRGDHLLQNLDTYQKLSMYVDLSFLRSLFEPYMTSRTWS